MNYNIKLITAKVNTFFKNLQNNNSTEIPSILYTYGKQFNIFGKDENVITDTNDILNNINNDKNKNKNIVILDSSFNPPTLAHIKLLTETFNFYCEQLLNTNENKDKFLNPTFILLITNNNVDKKLVGANISQRLKMMEIITDIFQKQIITIANDKYKSLNNEVNNIRVLVGLTNVGRFIDKVIAIKQFIPEANPAFIMGIDTITRFFMEKYYIGLNMKEILDGFFKDNSIICADRIMYEENKTSADNKSNNNNKLKQFITEGPAKPYKNKIYIFNSWLNDEIISKVSSSEARNILKENYSNHEKLQKFLPKEIIDFIIYYNIYN
ncbi:Nucleotidylyl transferase [Anaeromyces robustus]|uniref:Nucleotidylyl transferase n=1 Tax=Anaeromyces robustus TaxID=1754192 RepID=A0A1Y1VS01_9FUNG|nr:Nucleotidylyl transferase [Anaeromyces robustus]|eukprot:ORX63796.1 Nucleotidylyl transferase [Anaeromyces robustus]